MDSLLTRYRNLTLLLLVLFAQLILLAYQVRTGQDVRLIRVWAVTAVTPMARLFESMRSNTVRFLDGYIFLTSVQEENLKLKAQAGRLKLENQFLKSELGTADRAKALLAFQARTPSRTVAARIIGTGAGSNAKVIFLDRGAASGVQAGMAVITPDGIVGRVLAAYPTASQVLLITDPTFAAGVVGQKNHVEGTLKGLGRGDCMVDYLQNEQRVETGEWFYTSGDDRAFPRGLPVGVVTSARPGKTFKEVIVEPSALKSRLEEVLIVVEGVHQRIPVSSETAAGTYYLTPPPPGVDAPPAAEASDSNKVVLGTEADRLREHYEQLGEAQGHVYGEGLPGSKPPDFNLKLGRQNLGSPSSQPVPSASTPQAAPSTARPSRERPQSRLPAAGERVPAP